MKTADTTAKSVLPPITTEIAVPSPTHSSQVAAAEAPHHVLQPSYPHDQNLWSVMDELCPDRVCNAAGQTALLPLVPYLRSQGILAKISLSKQLEQLIQVPDWVRVCEGFRRIKIHPRPNLGDDFTW